MEKHESEYNMIDWWKKVMIKNYANFTGRARRAEYWYATLANVIVVLPFYIAGIIGLGTQNELMTGIGFGLYAIIVLATIIPTLAVSVRRLHDINKSGWLYLIIFIPLVGVIIFLVWFFTEGNRYTNNYGSDPKNPDEVEFDFERPQVTV